jgi:hypothetical protein
MAPVANKAIRIIGTIPNMARYSIGSSPLGPVRA